MSMPSLDNGSLVRRPKRTFNISPGAYHTIWKNYYDFVAILCNTLRFVRKHCWGGEDFLIFAGEIWPPSEDWQNLSALSEDWQNLDTPPPPYIF